MSVITVPVADRPECVHALNIAFDVAGRIGGRVVGYHLHPHTYDKKVIKTGTGPGKKALKLFNESAARAGVEVKTKITPGATNCAHWREMVGTPDKVMPIIAPLSDMVVVSRPKGSGKGKTGKTARDFLLEALRDGGRPTLILPQRKISAIGKRVLVGWNTSNSAVQALIGALPILSQAEEVVLHCAGSDYQSGPKAHHAKSYLAMHGIRAKITRSKGLHIEQELEEAYDAASADLFVMGAYSRSRLVERLLGGTSEHFIMRTKVPVLATHSTS